MNINNWKLIFALLWIIIIIVSWKIDTWENAIAGFPLVTLWIGIILGILIGIVSMELKITYQK